eukprot:Hpha_TRINITY_DN16214_c1_g5::TRINITY_DN16214_c1_g5_i3::g.16094::m.16094
MMMNSGMRPGMGLGMQPGMNGMNGMNGMTGMNGMQQQSGALGAPRQPGQDPQNPSSSDLALQTLNTALTHLTELLRVACHGVSVGVGFWATYSQVRATMPEFFAPSSAATSSPPRQDSKQSTAPANSSFSRRCVRQLTTWLLVALLYTLATKLWKRLAGAQEQGRLQTREAVPRLEKEGQEQLQAIYERLVEEEAQGHPTRGWAVEALLEDDASAELLHGTLEEEVLDVMADRINAGFVRAEESVDWITLSHELFGAATPQALPSSDPASPVAHPGPSWIVSFPYEAQRPDEVSLCVDDKVTVLDQRGPATGWWMVSALSALGERKEGLAPANYLAEAARNKF